MSTYALWLEDVKLLFGTCVARFEEERGEDGDGDDKDDDARHAFATGLEAIELYELIDEHVRPLLDERTAQPRGSAQEAWEAFRAVPTAVHQRMKTLMAGLITDEYAPGASAVYPARPIQLLVALTCHGVTLREDGEPAFSDLDAMPATDALVLARMNPSPTVHVILAVRAIDQLAAATDGPSRHLRRAAICFAARSVPAFVSESIRDEIEPLPTAAERHERLAAAQLLVVDKRLSKRPAGDDDPVLAYVRV